MKIYQLLNNYENELINTLVNDCDSVKSEAMDLPNYGGLPLKESIKNNLKTALKRKLQILRLELGYDVTRKDIKSLSFDQMARAARIMMKTGYEVTQHCMGLIEPIYSSEDEALKQFKTKYTNALDTYLAQLYEVHIKCSPQPKFPPPSYNAQSAEIHPVREPTYVSDYSVSRSSSLSAENIVNGVVDVLAPRGPWGWYGFVNGFMGSSQFGGYDPLIGGGYGQSYVSGELVRVLTQLGFATTRLTVKAGAEILTAGSYLAKHMGAGLVNLGSHLVNSGEFVFNVGGKAIQLLGSGMHSASHLAVAGIHGAGHLIGAGLQGLGHAGGAAISCLCHKDVCKCLGGGTVAAATVGGAALTAAPIPPPSTPPVDPSTIQPHTPQTVGHTSAHLIKHSGNAKALGSSAGTSGAASGSKAVTLTGLGLAKVIFGSIYSALLLPPILMKTYKDIKNLYHNRKVDRSAKRLTARTIGMAAGFILGWFIPFGGPITAMVLSVFGAYAAQKITKWYEQRQAKKASTLLLDPEILNKLDSDTQEEVLNEIYSGHANSEKYQLSSTELNNFEKQGLSTANAIIYLNRLQLVASAQKIISKRDQNYAYKALDACYGVYKENEKHKHAVKAALYIKKGLFSEAYTEMEKADIDGRENFGAEYAYRNMP